MWNCEQKPQSTFVKGLSLCQIMCVRCLLTNNFTALPRELAYRLWTVVEGRGLQPQFSCCPQRFQHRSNLEHALCKTGFTGGVFGDALQGVDDR